MAARRNGVISVTKALFGTRVLSLRLGRAYRTRSGGVVARYWSVQSLLQDYDAIWRGNGFASNNHNTQRIYARGERKKEGSLDAAAPPPLVASADTLYELNGATWGDTHTQTIWYVSLGNGFRSSKLSDGALIKTTCDTMLASNK